MIWDIVNEDWEQRGSLTTLFSGKCHRPKSNSESCAYRIAHKIIGLKPKLRLHTCKIDRKYHKDTDPCVL